MFFMVRSSITNKLKLFIFYYSFVIIELKTNEHDNFVVHHQLSLGFIDFQNYLAVTANRF